ncbi:hypothetical protein [Pseudomonas moorei]|uniref:Uncharacterized protein n=1 Tax=Pseudomonas moorei TaxID=395599 RepID=A0A1H1FLB3_9PSED|nr:hypothetical protein [Pseudomonas moorei]KAB0509629.1 hypothetical protein F7R06_01005 [Pseudomonas moorei]SDR01822.1 hypothetical protein SAMN04490195_2771 [Pseudomonas moorei]
MQYDIHEQNPAGGPGKLLDTIDRVPDIRKTDSFVEFDGEMHKVLTGIRNFIIVTQERWAMVSAAAWRKI